VTLRAGLEAAKSELQTAREEPAQEPASDDESAAGSAADPDELARARAELSAANQRISDLEAATRLGPAHFAPLPPPPAPR
jgi:hypothetical protein